ncbi:hypothetical protein PoB_000754600 [Plakobranchus ocellatus]|uniref:Uncharacterized protein n=1 Tax=Plakobranchus ocellatus TaxID=259542 RepID=A0AAV3YF79_9GAST|nr:hypothetical protein PoB_000754600 [Plakobranchus ocellatus]
MVVVLGCWARPPLAKTYLLVLYDALGYLQAKCAFFLNCSGGRNFFISSHSSHILQNKLLDSQKKLNLPQFIVKLETQLTEDYFFELRNQRLRRDIQQNLVLSKDLWTGISLALFNLAVELPHQKECKVGVEKDIAANPDKGNHDKHWVSRLSNSSVSCTMFPIAPYKGGLMVITKETCYLINSVLVFRGVHLSIINSNVSYLAMSPMYILTGKKDEFFQPNNN